MTETILVSYNQMCVFDGALDEPFNDWTDEHVRQGFAWRPGSVSFGMVENTETAVVIEATNTVEPDPAAFRVIAVPFTVPAHGSVVVGSIGDEREIEIDAGIYRLTFELGSKDKRPWCRISFVADPNPQPQIIRADSEITKRDALLMSATPAA
ncbi:competence protein ComJ [Burkholderia sp. AW33-5]|uniref:competence protein ComJ n=1 Tax=Burkholderia vietnamiensis TaxID=60552 RepID=UPI001CB6494B|nr:MULTISPECIES: competence protein ComJ [Burkholderia cepacia complex]MCA8446639.1 competence protein ComJ [Burkholderia vietnamiensis]CAG9246492.1 conserved hypothetical protein [Burkholderia diffusa]HDR8952822.1 hypothetical protein [Burkholderia vietnamiensis]